MIQSDGPVETWRTWRASEGVCVCVHTCVHVHVCACTCVCMHVEQRKAAIERARVIPRDRGAGGGPGAPLEGLGSVDAS